MKIDTSKIPAPVGGFSVAHKDGDTEDIIKELLIADKYFDRAFCEFAQQFRGDDGLKRLWKFVRTEIKYKEDGFNFQGLQTPAALWASKSGDCKSKTLFINAVLRCIGQKYITRFVSYGTYNVTHVYTVARINNKWVPIDAVHSKFGKEVPYSFKKDYPMTKIVHISGPSSKVQTLYKGGFAQLLQEYKPEVDKVLAESKEKASYIKQAEFIPFSQLDAGEVRARILLRQMEIQQHMRPEKAGVYKEAIEMTKRLIHNAGKGFTNSNAITGIVPAGMEALASVLNSAMKDTRPALRLRRPLPHRVSGIRLNAMAYFDSNLKFFLGKGSPYEKNFNSVIAGSGGKTLGQIYADAINAVGAENILDSNGNPITYKPIPHSNITVPYKKLTYNSTDISGQTLTAVLGGATVQNLRALPTKVLWFYNNDVQGQFEDRIKSASGIYDEYLNQLFAEDKALGGSFIYAYANDVMSNGQAVSMNKYPSSVNSKSTVHKQWVNGLAYFTGLENGNIKGLGLNSILSHSDGKTQAEMLKIMLQKYDPSIGFDPATWAIIIGVVKLLIDLALALMARSKKDAEEIEPEGVPSDWVPIGPELEFMPEDWEGAPGSSGGGGGTTDKKDNTLLYLGGGAAAFGLYLLTQQNDKKQ